MSEKVNQYKDIFQSRGIDHAEAFRRYPESVKEEVEAAGLQKPEPPKPLDAVSENQVRLVCWMAVKGRDEQTT